MSCKMLFFDYREPEEKFFALNNFANFEIKFFKESLNKETLKQLSEEDFQDTMIISVFITSDVCDDVISQFKNLRVISTRSTGYDHIDMNSCINKNIALLNVDSYGDTAVAQFTFGLILMLTRNIYPALNEEKNHLIKYNDFCGRDLNAMTIGVVGTGIIGGSICKIAKCFGMRVLANDLTRNNDLVSNYGVEYVELDALLKNSDIVTLHLPFTKDNYHMFGKEQFHLMKDNSYFINVSRGELIDTEALLKFARYKKFKGIALDVVACPSITSDGNNIDKSSLSCIETSQSIQELAEIPNVILTPHMAYNTQEAINYILKTTFESLSDYLKGGRQSRVV